MTETRALPTSGTGQNFMTDTSESFGRVSGYSGGQIQSPAGTNAYTGTFELATGLSGYPDGMTIGIVIPNDNTAACTFNFGQGTKPAVKQDGTAFSGGELTQGTHYEFRFVADDDEWRLCSPETASSSGGGGSTSQQFMNVWGTFEEGADSWTAPYNCTVRVWCVGSGGSGGCRSTTGRATGGGGGGMAYIEQDVLAGETISVDVGAAAGATDSTSDSDGVAGGATTASLGGKFSLVGNGGGAGLNSSNTGTLSGGAGGTATGGSANYSGGSGGDVNLSNTASGGGAAGGFDSNGQSVATNSEAGGTQFTGTNHFENLVHGPFSNPSNMLDGGRGSSATSGTSGRTGGGGAGVGDDGGAGGRGFVAIWFTEATS